MNLWFLVILIVSAVILLAIVAVSIYLCYSRGMCQCKRKKQTQEDSQDNESDEASSDRLETSEESDLENQAEQRSVKTLHSGSIPTVSERSSLLSLEAHPSRQFRKHPSMSSISSISSDRRKSLKLEDACGIIRFRLEFAREQRELILYIFYIYLGPIEPPSNATLYSVSATLLPKKKQKFETKARPFAPAEEENYIVSSFKRHMMIFKKMDDVKGLYRQALRLRIGEHKVGSETVIAEALVHLADLVQTDPLFVLDVWRPVYKITPYQKLDVRNLVQHAAVLQQTLKRSTSGNIEQEPHGSEISGSEETTQETDTLNNDPGVQSPDGGSDLGDMTTADSNDDMQSSRANLLR